MFPLFWHFRDSATGATAHALLPFYFRRNSPDEKLTAAGVFPLWGYYRSFTDGGASGGLFPLAFFGSRKDAATPSSFRCSGGSARRRRRPTCFFPFYYAIVRQAHLARWQGSASPCTSPATTARQLPLPVLPFYWNVVDGRAGTATTIASLYFRHAKTSRLRRRHSTARLLGRRRQQRHFAFFPLFWWFRDDAKDRTTTVVANYLHRRHGEGNHPTPFSRSSTVAVVPDPAAPTRPA